MIPTYLLDNLPWITNMDAKLCLLYNPKISSSQYPDQSPHPNFTNPPIPILRIALCFQYPDQSPHPNFTNPPIRSKNKPHILAQ